MTELVAIISNNHLYQLLTFILLCFGIGALNVLLNPGQLITIQVWMILTDRKELISNMRVFWLGTLFSIGMLIGILSEGFVGLLFKIEPLSNWEYLDVFHSVIAVYLILSGILLSVISLWHSKSGQTATKTTVIKAWKVLITGIPIGIMIAPGAFLTASWLTETILMNVFYTDVDNDPMLYLMMIVWLLGSWLAITVVGILLNYLKKHLKTADNHQEFRIFNLF